jgi:hypothetical protein
MAHFAKLDENNFVIEVHVVDNENLLDANGVEREEIGIAYLVRWSNGYPYWKQTSYNKAFRKNYAAIGDMYDQRLDGFIRPKKYASWSLNEETCQWEPPVPLPDDGKLYYWDEETLSWIEHFWPAPQESVQTP